jgi:gas vesicle protein GvpL/GvpF
MSPVYVYAISDRSPRVSGAGLAGEALEVVEGARVAAVVGAMAATPAVDEAGLRAHDDAVRRLAAQLPAVLPARFGSLAADADEIRRALDDGAEAYVAALEVVRGREQMTLRVLDPPGGAPAAAPLPAPAPDADAGAGTRYLAARAAASAASGVPGLRPLLDDLAAHVSAESVERHETPPLRASVYHLIPRGTAEAYLAAVRDASGRHPAVRVVASGPWPPYAFAAAPR